YRGFVRHQLFPVCGGQHAPRGTEPQLSGVGPQVYSALSQIDYQFGDVHRAPSSRSISACGRWSPSPAMVGVVKKSRSVTVIPSPRPRRPTGRVADNEPPPAAKKLVCRSAGAAPSVSAQIRAIRASGPVRAGSPCPLRVAGLVADSA